jgi:G3E family GTPase
MLHFPSPDIGMFGRRQRHARGHRIPVTVVGRSGGTPGDPDSAVVVDAFGTDEVPLHGGCPCCTVRAELQRQLQRLLAERQQGRHFSRVVIQTNGDLGAIRRTFATERALGSDFYLEDESGADMHGEGLTRFTLTEDAPLSWDTFSRFMATLMALRGADLLRVTGLLNVVGCRGPVVVQCVQHLAHPPVELTEWPDEDHGTRVVFATRGITNYEVANLFRAVRVLADRK